MGWRKKYEAAVLRASTAKIARDFLYLEMWKFGKHLLKLSNKIKVSMLTTSQLCLWQCYAVMLADAVAGPSCEVYSRYQISVKWFQLKCQHLDAVNVLLQIMSIWFLPVLWSQLESHSDCLQSWTVWHWTLNWFFPIKLFASCIFAD